MNAYLQSIAYYFPERCLTNDLLSELHPEWSPEKIARKTGISRRYLSANGETALDMAEKAAERLFAQGVDRSKIDFVLLCTQSPDYFLPTGACILQDHLGLRDTCGAFDYNLGCSGFVYGLGIAKGLIISGEAKNVLLLTSETYTKYLHPDDKSCQTIFGDAAAATLISSEKNEIGYNARILQGSFKTVGKGFDSLIVRNGAARHPFPGNEEAGNYLFMDGKAIFDFSALVVPEVIGRSIIQNGYTMDRVDYYLLHQANLYMMNIARMRCGIPAEKFIVDLEDGGNTVSSTIPIAFKRWWEKQQVNKGETMCLCGFGVGLSVACSMLIFE